jgi:ribonucleotide monophosphatase NagD (HAD superfamily)
MVGDSLQTDILFGNNCGIDTHLVLSGCTNLTRAKQIKLGNIHSSEGVPTYISPYFTYTSKDKITID